MAHHEMMGNSSPFAHEQLNQQIRVPPPASEFGPFAPLTLRRCGILRRAYAFDECNTRCKSKISQFFLAVRLHRMIFSSDSKFASAVRQIEGSYVLAGLTYF
jgi:hypothetical protein